MPFDDYMADEKTRFAVMRGYEIGARRRLAAIRADIRRLKQHPCRCPVGQHPGGRELPCAGGYRALYRVAPDIGRDETAGDVRVLRVFGPGQSRDRL
jgi:plasmid stabilization system protein ParE